MTHPINWKSKLLISIPCAEVAFSLFWQRLLTLQYVGWHIDNGRFLTSSNAYIQDAHCKIIVEALKMDGWDRLLFLEHDHVFPLEVLEMHGQQTEPIVSGLYFARSVTEPTPVVYNWNEDRTSIMPLQPWELHPMLENPGLHEVGVVPMGCTSIRRDVLEKWDEKTPWFAVPSGRYAAGGIMGDDVWFCRHAQDQGHKLYLDTRIKLDHLGLVPINLSVYSAWVRKLKREGHAKDNRVIETEGHAEAAAAVGAGGPAHADGHSGG